MVSVESGKDQGLISEAAVALSVLEDRLHRAMIPVKAQSAEAPVELATDPLDRIGRRALNAWANAPVGRAIREWLRSYEDFSAAIRQLNALAADDELRAGRHQVVYEAGLRWRQRVLGQRRAALLAATRTAQRALAAAFEMEVPAIPPCPLVVVPAADEA